LGADSVCTDYECTGAEQDERGVTVFFKTSTGSKRDSLRADIVVDCEGINSTLRRQFYPADKVAFAGINTWRGITRRKPILDGRTYMRVGSILTGKIVIYPIIDDVDGDGRS
jgi:2-polyprenyl-6-methoxyphenol hydroxylase-like FAD-dependent oxidoreductase